MRFLVPLIGVTQKDRLSSKEMRNLLQTANILKDIQYYQLNWTQRVDKTRIFPNKLLKYKPVGTRGGKMKTMEGPVLKC
jgi:hypothetical protein